MAAADGHLIGGPLPLEISIQFCRERVPRGVSAYRLLLDLEEQKRTKYKKKISMAVVAVSAYR